MVRPLDGFGAAEDGDRSAGPEEPVEDRNGDVGDVVLTAAERRTQALLNADDGEIEILNLEGSAERRAAAGEEIVLQSHRR